MHEFAKNDDDVSDYFGVVPALRTSQARFQQLAPVPADAKSIEGAAATHVDPVDDDEPSNR